MKCVVSELLSYALMRFLLAGVLNSGLVGVPVFGFSSGVVVVVSGVVGIVAADGGVDIREIKAKRRAGELLGPGLAVDLQAAPDLARVRAAKLRI